LNRIAATLHFGKRPQGPGPRESTSEAFWTPNTDVYLTDTGLVVKVELSGMRREDLEVAVEGHQLRISGIRRDGCRSPQCRFVVMEINYGHFESAIDLPPGYDLSSAKAAYQNGFLRVDVPLLSAQPAQPFSVPVACDEA
jgi:HSP20 family protein